MLQVARNLLDPVQGFLRHATHLIQDRDPMYAKAWTALLKSSGVKCAPIPAQRAVQVVVLASFDPAVFAVQGWVGPSLTDRCELHRLVRLRCAHWISLKMAPTGWQGSERTRSWLGSYVEFREFSGFR